MTADPHRELRELLGSYAVGALAPDETARVRAHVEGCRACAELLDELSSVASALAIVDPAHVATDPPIAAPIEPLLAQLDGERRRRRHFAGAGAAAAAAAAVLLAVVLISSEGPAAPVPDQRPLRSAATDVTGSVGLLDRFWGTQLTLEAEGLPARRPVVVWIERRGGRRVPAGTLLGLGETPIRAQLAASVRLGDAVSVGVSDGDGAVLLSSPVGG